MSYIKNSLIKDEQILAHANLHGVCYIKPVIILLACLIGFSTGVAILGVILLIWGLIEWLALTKTEYVVTNKRVVKRTGFLKIDTAELRLPKVESVSVSQTILGRCLGYGDICFSGTGSSTVCFKNAKAPLKKKKEFEKIIEGNN